MGEVVSSDEPRTARWAARLNAVSARVVGVGFTAPVAALVVSGVLCIAYLAWTPVAPDLAAQLARADLVRRAGDVSWWTGWFAGLSLPSYSLLAPPMMAAVGVAASGALLTVAACWGAGLLLRDTLRPRAGAVAFSLFCVADLLVGRVTFAVGLGFAVWALVALRARLGVLSAVLALLSYLSSPLAGLFLGLVLIAVVIVDGGRRVQAAILAGLLLLSGIAMAVLFPGTGQMHYSPTAAIAPGIGTALVAITCRTRVVRVAALIGLVALPAFMVVPGAVGSNIARLAWVCAVPTLIACATLDRRRLALGAVVLTAWPGLDLIEQVHWAPDPSTRAAYYQPLIHELRVARATAGPAARGERVELLDTVNHSGSLYLTPDFPLARGWDRQADLANNPIFYRDGALNADRYHAWLHALAVGWVAVPATKLDYAAADESTLIKNGLPYLQLIWSTPDWKLYRVSDATPLATGATVTAVGPSSVTLRTAAPSTVLLRVRWSPYLRAVDASTGDSAHACIAPAGDWTHVELPAAGRYSVVSTFDVTARFRAADADDCGAQPASDSP